MQMQNKSLLLYLFNVKFCLEKYWRELRFQEVGEVLAIKSLKQREKKT